MLGWTHPDLGEKVMLRLQHKNLIESEGAEINDFST